METGNAGHGTTCGRLLGSAERQLAAAAWMRRHWRGCVTLCVVHRWMMRTAAARDQQPARTAVVVVAANERGAVGRTVAQRGVAAPGDRVVRRQRARALRGVELQAARQHLHGPPRVAAAQSRSKSRPPTQAPRLDLLPAVSRPRKSPPAALCDVCGVRGDPHTADSRSVHHAAVPTYCSRPAASSTCSLSTSWRRALPCSPAHSAFAALRALQRPREAAGARDAAHGARLGWGGYFLWLYPMVRAWLYAYSLGSTIQMSTTMAMTTALDSTAANVVITRRPRPRNRQK